MFKFLRRQDYPLRVVLLLFVAFSLAGCNKNFDDYWNSSNPKGGYLYDRIKSNPEFSMFAEALDRANVAQFLVNGGSYTVFAPTNEAFSKFLTDKGYASINAVPEAELFKIASYHIVNNMWYYYDLRDRYYNSLNKLYSKNQRYLTRLRKYVDIDITVENSFKVNGIEVIKALQDIDADNGVIHGIPEVMVPIPNLEELFQSDPELANSTFYKLLKVLRDKTYDRQNSFDRNRDGIIDSVYLVTYPLLNGGANISVEYKTVGNTVTNSQGGTPAFTTILVPANALLDQYIAPALAKVQNQIDSLSPSYIEGILENYILADTLMTSAQIKSRTGNLRVSNGATLAAASLKTDADFIRKDIRASNGYIQVINNGFYQSDREKSALWQASIEPDFRLFMAAIQKANLMNTYGVSSRSATYLIPSNDAIRAAGLNIEKMQLNGRQLSATQFSNLVKHQIVNTSLNKAALTGTKTAEAGGSLIFSDNGNAVANTNTPPSSATIGTQLYVGPSNTGYVYKSNNLLIPLF